MNALRSTQKRLQESCINYELYLWKEFPAIAETFRILSAEILIEKFSFSSEKSADNVSALPKPQPVFQSFRRAERTDFMALTNFSFREAEVKYPHLFAYL